MVRALVQIDDPSNQMHSAWSQKVQTLPEVSKKFLSAGVKKALC